MSQVASTGLGIVTVQVTQPAAQSSNGIGASGDGADFINCNGNEQKLGVEVGAQTGFWNLGSATAQASLTAPSGNAFAVKTISITL